MTPPWPVTSAHALGGTPCGVEGAAGLASPLRCTERPDRAVVHRFPWLTCASVPGQAPLQALGLWREESGPMPRRLVGQLPAPDPAALKAQDGQGVPRVQEEEGDQTAALCL